jgi:hypothetical protein
VRFTATDGALHAIVLGTPSSAVVEIADVTVADGATVELLGHTAPLRWERTDAGGLRVTLPGRPAESPAIALKISNSTQ